MFYGEHASKVDPEGRIVMPVSFRRRLGGEQAGRSVLTRGLDGCLFLFPESEWRLVEMKFSPMAFTKPEGRAFNRMLFSGAEEVACDPSGRLPLPKALKEFAKIQRDVTVVGVSTRIEIWAKEKWQAFSEAVEPSLEAIAERLVTE